MKVQITKATWLFVIIVFVVAFVPARPPWRVAAQAQPPPTQAQPPPTQAQQRPVFRGGTHFVRVDAYPSENGKIVEGLKPEDFQILEDGKPQAIESFDFMKFDSFTPEAKRRDPVSQQAGFDMAADPRYRVFVVYVDLTLSQSAHVFPDGGGVNGNPTSDLPKVQQPLVNFFERVVGPQDLYALMTTRNSVKDLTLAQKTTVTVSEINDLFRATVIERDEADEVIGFCSFGINDDAKIALLKYLYRADATYTNLKELTVQLGSLRQERKNLVLVTNLLPRWGPNRSFYESLVDPRGGQNGIQNGRITSDNREIVTNGRGGSVNGCQAEAARLALMDFEPRYRELLDEAKRQNVSVYVITPGGLQAPPTVAQQSRGEGGLQRPEVAGRRDRRHRRHRHQRSERWLPAHRRRPGRLLRARLLHDEHEVRRRAPQDHGKVEGQADPCAPPVPRAHRGGDRGDGAERLGVVAGCRSDGGRRSRGRHRRAGRLPRQPYAAAGTGQAAGIRPLGSPARRVAGAGAARAPRGAHARHRRQADGVRRAGIGVVRRQVGRRRTGAGSLRPRKLFARADRRVRRQDGAAEADLHHEVRGWSGAVRLRPAGYGVTTFAEAC